MSQARRPWKWQVTTPSLYAPGITRIQGYERTWFGAWWQAWRRRTRDSAVEVRKVLVP